MGLLHEQPQGCGGHRSMASSLLVASPSSQLTQSHSTDPVAQHLPTPHTTPHPPRLRDLHDTPFSRDLTPPPAALPGSYVQEGHIVGCFHRLSQKLTQPPWGPPPRHTLHSLVSVQESSLGTGESGGDTICPPWPCQAEDTFLPLGHLGSRPPTTEQPG